MTMIALLLVEMLVLTLPRAVAISTEVYVYPSQNVFYYGGASIGFRFNLTVWVNNVSDLATWQVQMSYDSFVINCTRVWQPTWDDRYVFYGRTTYPVISFNAGYVLLGDVLVPWNQSKFAGAGKLCIIEFQIIRKPLAGGELSSMFNITNSTFLLDSQRIEIPTVKTDGYYGYIDRSVPISRFQEVFASNPDARMIYPSNSSDKPLGVAPAMVSDWTASAFILVRLQNVSEGMDIDKDFVNQTTGRVYGSNGTAVVSFGGPCVNLVVMYAENGSTAEEDRAPIKFYSSGALFSFRFANGTAIPAAQLNEIYINYNEDMFVIESYRDADGKYIMFAYGFGWKGTYAAGKYFDAVIYPSLQVHTESWIIVRWEDTNGDGFVNTPGAGDSYVVIATGS